MHAPSESLLEYLELNSERQGPVDLSAAERQMLDDVNTRIAARESTEAVVDFLFERTAQLCPGDRLSIALVDETGQRLVSHYTRATYESLVLRPGYAEDLRGSSLDRVISEGRIRLIHDLRRYLEWRPGSASSRALVEEGVQSSLTCPLRVEGRVVGALFRSSRAPRAYTRHHAWVHAMLAERLSQVVEKTYRLEQLAAANLAYSEMLGFVSHELKSPVASMVSTAHLFADGYLGPIDAQQKEAIGRIIAKGNYLLDLVRDYLELARIEGGELRFAPRSDVAFEEDVLRVALDVVRPDAVRRRMKVEREIDLPGPVQLDDSLMRIVMVNLLGNAVKYGRDGGLIRIAAKRRDDALEVRVFNEGPGFPAEEKPRLFRRFSRLRTPELRSIKGSGVGLYTVWRILQLHGATITAHSKVGECAEFVVTLPQEATRHKP